MRAGKPDWQEKIARERVQILFGLARKEYVKSPARSRRYVELARKIGMRYNVRFSRQVKESFCKKCNSVLVPGKTMTTRLDSAEKAVIIKCNNCNYSYRKRYK